MPLTLDILEIGARGDGVAEPDGERYFVPFTLPGEVVEAVLAVAKDHQDNVTIVKLERSA